MLDFFLKSQYYKNKVAIIDCNQNYTYDELLEASKKIASTLLNGQQDLHESRVAFIVDPSFNFVAILCGIWLAGGVAVPLCVKHPYPSIKYVLEDTKAEVLIYEDSYLKLIEPVFNDFCVRTLHVESLKTQTSNLPEIDVNRRAMIVYTSGTTGRPKGVVTTHHNILAQVKSLTECWEITEHDQVLNVLPLHHVHGIIGALCCPLYAAARVEFLPKFHEALIFDVFQKQRTSVFMAVPTIYYKLITYFNTLNSEQKANINNALKTLRVMISGSGALPISTLNDWQTISGQILLERYGMTELGLVISNPLHGERRPGFIGLPMPGITVRLTDDTNQEVLDGPGEIQIKGEGVFLEYWQNPQATASSFVDQWFKTGDIAVLENGYYKILGRNSVDIIKTGGYKVSALEIEEVLRQRPDVEDCAVVGIKNDEWGEIIGAAIINKLPMNTEELISWLKERLPNYKLPRTFLFLTELPRNVLGKIIKKEVQHQFEAL